MISITNGLGVGSIITGSMGVQLEVVILEVQHRTVEQAVVKIPRSKSPRVAVRDYSSLQRGEPSLIKDDNQIDFD